MIVSFTKMHGLGNDFVVIDQITQHHKLYTAHFQSIADRNFGVGCDQVLLVEPPTTSDADFSYRIFNADGSEAAQCGNGIRCVAKFVHDIGLVDKQQLVANSKSGKIICNIADHNLVSIALPIAAANITRTKITANEQQFTVAKISLGNPHGVLQVSDLNAIAVAAMGAELVKQFAEPLNISFMQVVDRANIKLRVYERGVGVTLACGTAAAAAVLLGINSNILNNKVTVAFASGNLELIVDQAKQLITQTGPTATVFSGKFRV